MYYYHQVDTIEEGKFIYREELFKKEQYLEYVRATETLNARQYKPKKGNTRAVIQRNKPKQNRGLEDCPWMRIYPYT